MAGKVEKSSNSVEPFLSTIDPKTHLLKARELEAFRLLLLLNSLHHSTGLQPNEVDYS